METKKRIIFRERKGKPETATYKEVITSRFEVVSPDIRVSNSRINSCKRMRKQKKKKWEKKKWERTSNCSTSCISKSIKKSKSTTFSL
jgi:hypothetical protein